MTMDGKNASGVASGAIEALKGQPIVLALVLLQAFVLAAVLYSSLNRQEAVSKEFAALYELLSACVKANAAAAGTP
jgi:hypothetical protein